MKNILVPTDFSDCAAFATEIGMQIAERSDAKLHLLHCYESEITQEKNKLESIKHDAEQRGLITMCALEKDSPHKRIVNYAQENKANFIVMGSHGLSSNKSQFIGTNTQRVVRHANCPVLTIKHPIAAFAPKRIVYASNFEREQQKTFEYVLEFAKLYNATIDLVYINTPGSFEESKTSYAKMDWFIAHHKNDFTTSNIYNDFNPTEGIINFAHRIKADLISMTTLGRTGIHRFIDNSITENVVNFSNLPVLSLNQLTVN